MARGRPGKPKSGGDGAVAGGQGATTGYEAELWRMADALRGSMDAAEYKHVVLGLIFLKYISDAFEETHARLEAERAEGADPEDPDEYRAENIFWVPPEARWSRLKARARQPSPTGRGPARGHPTRLTRIAYDRRAQHKAPVRLDGGSAADTPPNRTRPCPAVYGWPAGPSTPIPNTRCSLVFADPSDPRDYRIALREPVQ